MTTDLNPLTGLPPLEEPYYWRVSRALHREDDELSDHEHLYVYKSMNRAEVTRHRRYSWLPFIYDKLVSTEVKNANGRAVFTWIPWTDDEIEDAPWRAKSPGKSRIMSLLEITPADILRTAESIVEDERKQAEDNATLATKAELIGAYPPKKLEHS